MPIGRAADDRDAQRLGAGAHHFQRLRQHVVGDEEALALALADACGQGHGLGGGGRLVEHRGVGQGHAGEVGHHRLEVQQRFEPALRNLGLVGRVGGVPGRVLEHVAQDHAGREGAVVALADAALAQHVLRRDAPEFSQCLGFGGGRRELHRVGARNAARHHRLDEGAPRGRTDHREHVPLGCGVDADVAGDELARVL